MSKSTKVQGNKVTETVSTFDSGIGGDPHSSVGWLELSHAYTEQGRMTPRVSSRLLADSTVNSNNPLRVCINKQFGGGDVPVMRIMTKNSDTSAKVYSMADFSAATWVQEHDFDEGDVPHDDTFMFCRYNSVYYIDKTEDFNRLASSGTVTQIESSWDEGRGTFKYVRPIEHIEDDRMYIPENNRYHAYSDFGTLDGTLTLPSRFSISAHSEYSNYVVLSLYDPNRDYSYITFWNREVDTPYTDPFKWCDGEVIAMATLDGILVSIVRNDRTTSVGKATLDVYTYNGIASQKVNYIELDLDNNAISRETIFTDKANYAHPKSDGKKLYIETPSIKNGNSTLSNCLLSVDSEGKIVIEHRQKDTSPIVDFDVANNLFITSNKSNGANGAGEVHMTYTDLATTSTDTLYSTPTRAVTKVWDGNLPSVTKQVESVEISHEKLPTGGQITIEFKYAGDSDTEWQTVGISDANNSGDDNLYQCTFTNYEDSNGDRLDFETYHQKVWRITSSGGAVPTGFTVISNIIPDQSA